MNKILKYGVIVLGIICSFTFIGYVKAETVSTSTENASALEDYEAITSNEGKVTCEDLLGYKDDEGSLMSIISDVYNMIRIGAVILVIVLGMIDFTGAVSSSDADKLNKSINKMIRRLIILVVLFLVPTLLDLVLSLVFGPDFLCKL